MVIVTDAIITCKQFVRYSLVGLASNAILYLLYLVATSLGLGPKTAMTSLYLLGVLQTFVFNKRWTFGHRGAHGPVFLRYCIAHGVGYAVNLTSLVLLVDLVGLPHQLVQGVMILVIAAMFFLAQKYWVFDKASRSGLV